MFVVLSKIDAEKIVIDTINNTVNNLLSNNAEIFYYSSFKDFNLEFYFQGKESLNEIAYQINDNFPLKANIGYNQVHIRYDGKQTDGITAFKLSSSDFFAAEKFSISNIGFLSDEIQIVY